MSEQMYTFWAFIRMQNGGQIRVTVMAPSQPIAQQMLMGQYGDQLIGFAVPS